MKRAPLSFWRLAPCVLFGVALVQFLSVNQLYVSQPSAKPSSATRAYNDHIKPRTKRAEREPRSVPTVGGQRASANVGIASTAMKAGNLSGNLSVTEEGAGIEQTKKWINVVSGSPHWLSPSEGSDALLLSLEREANAKFGLSDAVSLPAAVTVSRHAQAGVSLVPSPATNAQLGGGMSARTSNAVAGLHAFYYAWYGTPEVDGKWIHWNHEVLPHWGGPAVNSKYATVGTKYKPPERIGSNFFPWLGPYSSRNATVIKAHVEMLARAGIGVLVYSWWGRIGDANGDPADDAVIGEVGRACAHYRIKFAFHLEPYKGRNAKSVKLDLQHLMSEFGNHTALYRIGERPVFYVYDSYHTSKEEWYTLLGEPSTSNPMSIRGTPLDAVMLGLWVEAPHGQDLLAGGFDGFYTYFATDGMTYGSTQAHWPAMQQFARRHHKLFVPSIGPGYIDTAIRPWNYENRRDRQEGAYYDSSWSHALALSPDIISLTSFNEWHEGTQLEPAQAHPASLDYGLKGERYYLDVTRKHVESCRSAKDGL